MEDAIINFRLAIEQTVDGDSDKPTIFSNLEAALQPRLDRLGDLQDLEDAIENYRKAVQLAPDGHHRKAVWLNNISSAFRASRDSQTWTRRSPTCEKLLNSPQMARLISLLGSLTYLSLDSIASISLVT
jgi:tetratricopeptide (TPR) repeat protein